jgi:hypothetical protein
MSMISIVFSISMNLPYLWAETPTVSSFTGISFLVVSLVRGLLDLTLSTVVGEGNTNFLPLKPAALVEVTSTRLGSGIGGAFLCEDCESPPPS